MKGRKIGGRVKGTPNKATSQAREAIARFVDENAHRPQGWLDGVAEGVQSPNGKWLIPPNPQRAFELFQSVVEFHIPKLQRSDLYAKVDHSVTRLSYAEERAREAEGDTPGLAPPSSLQ
jgi:hypothetical protein